MKDYLMYWVVFWLIVGAGIVILVYVNWGDHNTPKEFERKDNPHDQI